jgi:hypothetical protein
MDRSRLRRIAVRTALGGLVLLAAIQLVPYGWWHDNPPVTVEAPWPDAESADLTRESCYSCHSNETDWPIYSYVAPFSWLVRRDVESGRDELNFSTWDRDEGEADDAIESIVDGSMPPDRYTVIHRGARLTDDEVDVLVEALARLDAGEDGGSGNSGSGNSGSG